MEKGINNNIKLLITPGNTEKSLLSTMDIFEDLTKEKKLTAPIIHAFQAQYGPKFFKALEFLQPEGPKVQKTSLSPIKFDLMGCPRQKNFIFGLSGNLLPMSSVFA